LLVLPSERPLQGREIEIAGKASCFQKKARLSHRHMTAAILLDRKKRSAGLPEARLRASPAACGNFPEEKRRNRVCRRGFG